MSTLRKNTLVVDFSVLPERPDADKVEKFLEKEVKLQLTDTKNIQLHNIRNCVYIEMTDHETALRYEKANYNKRSFVCNNREFKIPIYVESEAVTVRVHDLPTHTHHMTVVEFMQQYGVVISITRERWKHYFAGIYNGVRVLRMKLNRPIPSCVTIDGEKTLVTYRNQPKTCRHCGEAAHPKQKCAREPTIAVNDNKAPPQAPACDASGQQLDEEDFPPLSVASVGKQSNLERDEVQHTKTNNKNNKTSDVGDNGNVRDDNDDRDDEDDNSDSSGGNEFTEATNQKRRMSQRLLSKKSSDTKKPCFNQSNQNSNRNSNRFHALVEIDSLCPSEIQSGTYSNTSNSRSKDCNSSM